MTPPIPSPPNILVLGNGTVALSMVEVCATRARCVGWLQSTNLPDGTTRLSHPIAQTHIIPDINTAESQWLVRDLNTDIILSCWPQMLTANALANLPPVLGTHPTLLPTGAGRHPLHWLHAMGATQTAWSLFRMTEQPDAGPIVAREPFPLGHAIGETLQLAAAAMTRLLNQWFDRDCNLTGQPQTGRRTYWRARTEADITIDPRMSPQAIVRLTGSYSSPFPGCIWREKRVEYAQSVLGHFKGNCLGATLAEDPSSTTIQCDGGAIQLFWKDEK